MIQARSCFVVPFSSDQRFQVKSGDLGLHSSLVSVFLGRKSSCIAGLVEAGSELKEELFPQVSLAVSEVEQVRR